MYCARVGSNPTALANILNIIADNIKTFNTHIILLCQCISETEFDQLQPIFDVISILLDNSENNLSVPFANQRVAVAMEKILKVMDSKKKFPKKTRTCIEFLEKLAHDNKLVENYIKNNRERFIWIENWKSRNNN